MDAIARQVAGPVQTVMLPDCAHSPHQSLQKDAALAAVVDFVDTVREAG